MAKMTFTTQGSRNRIEKLKQLLTEQGMSIMEICDAVFLTPRWARAYVKHLYDNGQIYITAWTRTPEGKKDHPIPVYQWGTAKDAKRPVRKTGAERQRDARARLAEDVLEYAARIARRRAKRLQPYRDWSAAWIPDKERHEEVQT